MICPICSCELRKIKSKNVIIDVCRNCSGIWFDSGELQLFLQQIIESPDITPESTRLFTPRHVETSHPSVQENRVCPKCSVVMKTFNYAYDSNVFLDKCQNCDGIWAEAGEVKQIARFLKKDPKVMVIAQDIVKRQQYINELHELADIGNTLRTHAHYSAFMPKIFLPLNDDYQAEKFPVVNISIILVSVLVFLLQLFVVQDPQAFLSRFGFNVSQIWSIGLISSTFLHGGIFHILGNMYFLWIFGDNIEDHMGRIRFLVFYIASGIAACFLHASFYNGPNIPLIGASGAISGVMGAYCVLYPQARLQVLVFCRIIWIPASIYLTSWFLFQILYSIITLSSNAYYRIAWVAHVGGFIFGMLTAYIMKKKKIDKVASTHADT